MLLLSDQVDSFWPERLDSFEDKPIRSITQGSVDLSAIAPAVAEGEPPADTAKLLPLLKAALEAEVSEVRTTDRLVDSAVVLAAPEHGPDLQMQRLLRRAGRGFGAGLPVLEVNPQHPLIRRLAELAEAGDDLKAPAGTLLDLARLQDGDTPRDPAGFARQVSALLAGSLQ